MEWNSTMMIIFGLAFILVGGVLLWLFAPFLGGRKQRVDILREDGTMIDSFYTTKTPNEIREMYNLPLAPHKCFYRFVERVHLKPELGRVDNNLYLKFECEGCGNRRHRSIIVWRNMWLTSKRWSN